MPSLKDIRRRIGSVKNMQKITRAMKLVSTAKFARANVAVVSARPYGQAFDTMVERLVAAAGDETDSPLLVERPEKKILVVVLATDRGFCGSLNSNLFKQALHFIADKRREGVEVTVAPWGRRARQFATKLRYETANPREKVLEKPNYPLARELANELIGPFAEGSYDRVYVAYVEFRSALSQTPTVSQLLPLGRKDGGAAANGEGANILVEPAPREMLEGLLRRAVAGKIFRYLLEGAASEHGARMTAMDSATNNAQEVLRKMQIQYNRARQASITKELIEITSGAQAL